MTSTNEEIESMLEDYDKEVANIKHTSLKMCWSMRGGVTYSEIMNMGVAERKMISDITNDNIETTKKTNLPYF